VEVVRAWWKVEHIWSGPRRAEGRSSLSRLNIKGGDGLDAPRVFHFYEESVPATHPNAPCRQMGIYSDVVRRLHRNTGTTDFVLFLFTR
jgi:hypothetical protein